MSRLKERERERGGGQREKAHLALELGSLRREKNTSVTVLAIVSLEKSDQLNGSSTLALLPRLPLHELRNDRALSRRPKLEKATHPTGGRGGLLTAGEHRRHVNSLQRTGQQNVGVFSLSLQFNKLCQNSPSCGCIQRRTILKTQSQFVLIQTSQLPSATSLVFVILVSCFLFS